MSEINNLNEGRKLFLANIMGLSRTKSLFNNTKRQQENESIKQFLHYSLKEGTSMFLQQYKDLKISFPNFLLLSPQHAMLEHNAPQTTCLCKYHEIVRLLLIALENILPHLPLSFREFSFLSFVSRLRKIICSLNVSQISYF